MKTKMRVEPLSVHVLRFSEWEKAVNESFPKTIAKRIIKNKEGEWWEVRIIEGKIGEMIWGK
jgi:hypothetical protein